MASQAVMDSVASQVFQALRGMARKALLETWARMGFPAPRAPLEKGALQA